LPWKLASVEAQVWTRPPALGLLQANSGVLLACTVSSRGTAPNPWASAVTLQSFMTSPALAARDAISEGNHRFLLTSYTVTCRMIFVHRSTIGNTLSAFSKPLRQQI
jgi:hypothetical protein